MNTTSPESDTMPRRGYPYSRCSQKRQAEGDSLRRQDDWPKEVCVEQGWTYDDTYSLVDKGKSGFHRKNLSPTAGLTRFLELVKEKTISPGSVLIIENIDRLSRADVDTAHDLFRDIIRQGIWICTKTPFRIYRQDPNKSFMDLLEPIWIMYVAHLESLKKSQRIADNWEEARAQAVRSGEPVPARPPAWLCRTPEGFAIVEERAETVREVFRLAREGYGYTSIIQQLDSKGTVTFGRSKSKQWNEVYISKILRGRQVLGEYRPGKYISGKRQETGEVIADYYPPIITEDDWMAAQAAINSRAKKRGRPNKRCPNLFTGLIRDAQSGLPLAVQSKRFPNARCPEGLYYLATRKRGGITVQYQALQEAIFNTIKELRPEDVLPPVARYGEREAKIDQLDKQLTALRVRRHELDQDLTNPEVDLRSTQKALKTVEERETVVAKEVFALRLETESGRTEALSNAQTLIELLESKTGPERTEVERRIKATLPILIDGIWLRIQPVTERTKIVHIQIYLRGGGKPRYVQIHPDHLHGIKPEDFADVDFRSFEGK
jgi:DNA invertase Pin-like site-specific DNA recombinase